jgi:small-conductance mechanosensitive channel
LALVAYIGYIAIPMSEVDPLLYELLVAIGISIASILLFQLLNAISKAPKYLSQHPHFRSIMTIALRLVLALVLITSWTGYQSFSAYIMKGTSISVIFIFSTWFIYNVFLRTLESLSEGRYQWQKSVFKFLKLKEDDSLFELTIFRLVGFLVFWSSQILAINYIWSISDTWSRGINAAFFKGFMIQETLINPSRIIIALMFFAISMFLLRGIRTLLKTRLSARNQAANVAHIIIIEYLAFAMALFIAVLIAGVNIRGLAIIAGALSLGIGFGLQSIVNNFFSGIVLLLERPIKPGDRIIVGDKEGFVTQVGVRSTRINTIEHSDVIVPNSELVGTQVTNFMYNNKRWLIIAKIDVEYGTDPDRVEQLLLEIANKHPDIEQNQQDKPVVFFMSFGDNALKFELWTVIKNVNQKFFVTSDLHREINQVFNENGIVIAFPQSDIHIKDSSTIPLGHPAPNDKASQ